MKHTPETRRIERAWQAWLKAFGIPVNMKALRKTMRVAFEAGFRSVKENPDEVAQAQRRAQEAAQETRTRVVRRTVAGVARNVNETVAAIAERERNRTDSKQARIEKPGLRTAGRGRRHPAQAGSDGDVQQ